MNNPRAIRRLCTQLLQLLTFKTEPNRHKKSDPIICSVTEQDSSFWTNIGLNIWYKIGHSVYDGNMIGHRGFRCIHFISYIILYRHQNTVSLVLIRGNTIWLCWPLILLEWMYQSVGLFVWFAARPSSPKTTSSQNNRWLYKKCRQRLCCSFL